ncbi:hypothetical protein AB0L86_14390 [Micromonospora musae]|uniref:hypothetical protein n=1 Tax=Micromonospora musae TaxID=1894970 RepID=UPI003434F18A
MQRDVERPRLPLASLDFLGSDAQLRAQAEYALRESETRRQLSVNSGQDPSGSIAVFVDEDGQVEEVTVGPAWRDQVGVSVPVSTRTSCRRSAFEEATVSPSPDGEPRGETAGNCRSLPIG